MNKKHALYVLVLCCLLPLSCTWKDKSSPLPEWKEAEKLIDANPDSALNQLDSIGIPPRGEAYERALWCMYTTYAQVKANKSPGSDSIIRFACDFFDHYGDPALKAKAYTYRGYIFDHGQKANDVEMLTKYMLIAEEAAEKADDASIKIKIYDRLGNAYIFRGLYDYAERYYEKMAQCAQDIGEQRFIFRATLKQTLILRVTNRSAEAATILEELLQQTREAEDWSTYITAAADLGCTYIRELRMPAKSLAVYREALRHNPDTITLPIVYMGLASVFIDTQQVDSAEYYLRKSSELANIYTKQGIYILGKYLYTEVTKDYKKALAYNDSVWQTTDSIQRLDKGKAIIALQEQYHHARLEIEKNALQIERDVAVRNGLVATIVLFAVLFFLANMYRRKLRLKEELLHRSTSNLYENEERLRHNEQRMAKLQAQITADNEEVQEQQAALSFFQQQSEVLHQENLRLQQRIDAYKNLPKPQELEAMKVQSERLRQLEERERVLSNELANNDDLMRSLRERPKFLKETEWKKLSKVTDKVYNGFTSRLSAEYPNLTEVDMQLCILLKLRFTVSQIAIFTAVSPGTVSIQKQRLKKRILQENAKALDNSQSLDLWAWEY